MSLLKKLIGIYYDFTLHRNFFLNFFFLRWNFFLNLYCTIYIIMVINDRYLLWMCMYVKVKLFIISFKVNNIEKILIVANSNIRYTYNIVSIQTVIIKHLLRKVSFQNSAKCNMFIF